MMRKLKVATITVVLAGALLAPASAHGALKSIWGPLELPSGKSAFPTYKRLGVDLYQMNMSWAAVAPTKPRRPTDPKDPAYNWPSEVSEAVRQGRKHGIRVVLVVTRAPEWANGGKPSHWAPRRARDFGRFFTAASRKFRRVKHWSIWGEPSRAAVFQPLPKDRPTGPRRYAKMVDAAYRALKRRSRSNTVIAGNTFTVGDVSPTDFVRWFRLPNGRPPPLDWWGHNPFGPRFPNLKRKPMGPDVRDFSDLDTFIREVRRPYRRTGRTPRIFISEWTIQSDHSSHDFTFFVSRKVQARWIRRAFSIARSRSWIAALGWFQLLDEPESIAHNAHWGLLTESGRRKPAYNAYRRSRARYRKRRSRRSKRSRKRSHSRRRRSMRR